MKPVFWLFLLFVLASGLSAWIGNAWGRVIGKRKLSIFALRPKHTSSFLTILLSIALSMGFLGVYLLVDKNAREALLTPESRQEHQSQLMQQQATAFSTTLQRLQHRFWPEGDKLAAKPLEPSQPALGPLQLAAATATQAGPRFIGPPPSTILATAPMRLAAQPPQASAKSRPDLQSAANLTHMADLTDLDKAEDAGADTEPAAPRQRIADPLLDRARVPIQPRLSGTPAQKPVTGPLPEATDPDSSDRIAALPALRQAAADHGSAPESAAVSLAPGSSAPPATQVAMLSTPVFQLRVFGGRSQAESIRILDGVLGMTRTYARDLGLTAAREPLQIQTANLLESRQALQKAKVYQLQVKVGRVAKASRVLPVRLVFRPETPAAGFDPQDLLEQARLNPDSNQSLHADLREAILALAQETRNDLLLDDGNGIFEDGAVATANLPIQIMQLHRSGNTLQGQIVLLAEAANLTEN